MTGSSGTDSMSHLDAATLLQRHLAICMAQNHCVQSCGSVQRHRPLRGPHHRCYQLCRGVAPHKGVLQVEDAQPSCLKERPYHSCNQLWMDNASRAGVLLSAGTTALILALCE